MNISPTSALTLTIWPPYFDSVSSGKKTVEGRPFNARYVNLTKGDLIEVVNKDRCDNFLVEITQLTRYLTFQAMLEQEGLEKCLPNVNTIEEGVRIYRSFPNYEAQEKQYGVIAIAIKVHQACQSTVLNEATSNTGIEQGIKRKTPTKSHEEFSCDQEGTTNFSKNNRTQYVARRVITPDSNRAPKVLEVTLKKIYVDMIKNGTKTVEGRIDSGMFQNLQVGQRVKFFYMGHNAGEVVCQITQVNRYDSFEDMLAEEGYERCLPEAPSMEAAVRTYHGIPGYKERARDKGVIAIHIQKISEN